MWQSNGRWAIVYATRGTINTSDRNEKCNIQELDEKYKKLFTNLRVVTYNWKDDIQTDASNAKTHIGFISQEVAESAVNNLISPETLGLLHYEDITEESSTLDEDADISWGLNYSELHGIEVAIIQDLLKRVETLENRLASLV